MKVTDSFMKRLLGGFDTITPEELYRAAEGFGIDVITSHKASDTDDEAREMMNLWCKDFKSEPEPVLDDGAQPSNENSSDEPTFAEDPLAPTHAEDEKTAASKASIPAWETGLPPFIHTWAADELSSERQLSDHCMVLVKDEAEQVTIEVMHLRLKTDADEYDVRQNTIRVGVPYWRSSYVDEIIIQSDEDTVVGWQPIPPEWREHFGTLVPLSDTLYEDEKDDGPS